MSTSDDKIHLLPLDGCYDYENSSNESDDSIEVVSNVDEEENHIIDMTKYLTFSDSSADETETNGDDNHCLPLHVINDNRSLLGDTNNHCSPFDVVVNRRPSLAVNSNNCCSPEDIDNHCCTLDDACFKSNSDASDDEPSEYHPLNASATSSSSDPPLMTVDTIPSSSSRIEQTRKRKRRQWSLSEKLSAIATLKLNGSKHRTAFEHGCTTAQLRKWLKNEVEIIDISKEKKGMLF